MAVDTLKLEKTSHAVQARITLFTEDLSRTPSLRAYGIAFSKGEDQADRIPSTSPTRALDVPMRSQMVYPDGGEVWCSPTSTSMVMDYWARLTGSNKRNDNAPITPFWGESSSSPTRDRRRDVPFWLNDD